MTARRRTRHEDSVSAAPGKDGRLHHRKSADRPLATPNSHKGVPAIAAQGRHDPFATPSRNARFLRNPALRHNVFG